MMVINQKYRLTGSNIMKESSERKSSAPEVNNKKIIETLNHPKIAHELGILSQLIYKNSSAHRCQKYFQALKKIDRHMHDFTSLGLIHVLHTCSADTVILKMSMVKAIYLLQEVEENCTETVSYCLPQLHLERFIGLHTLHVNVVTNIWNHVRGLIEEIITWLNSTYGNEWVQHEKKGKLDPSSDLSVVDRKSTPDAQNIKANLHNSMLPDILNSSIIGRSTVDVGEVISRGKLLNKPFANLTTPIQQEDISNTDLIRFNKTKYSNSPLRLKHYHIRFLKYRLQLSSRAPIIDD